MKLPRKKRDETSAALAQTLWLMAACFGLLALTASASDPAWWSSRGAVVAPEVTTNDGVVTTNYVQNDYAAVTQGQLKQFTARAVDELNANLTGGAGTNLNTMVSNWAADYASNGYNATNLKPSDFTAMNVGQLKYIGNKVWSQLVAGGYATNVPSWLAQNTNSDNQAANVGQLKQLFDFDLADVLGLPAAPSSLNVTPSNSGELDLTWNNNATNATSITIEQSSDGGTNWTTVATLTDPTINAYAVTSLTNGDAYLYQIFANNSAGSSSTGGGSGGGSESGGSGSGSDDSGTPTPPAPQYAVIDLGTNFTPLFFNNKEQVVGSTNSGSINTAYCLWNQGTLTAVTNTGSYASNTIESIVGIDDNGNVVGNCASGSGYSFWGGYGDTPMPSTGSPLYSGNRVFTWNGGTMTLVSGTLPAELGSGSFKDVSQLATGVEANGTIYGTETDGEGAPSAWPNYLVSYNSPVTWTGGSVSAMAGGAYIFSTIEYAPNTTPSTQMVSTLSVGSLNNQGVGFGSSSTVAAYTGAVDYVMNTINNVEAPPGFNWGYLYTNFPGGIPPSTYGFFDGSSVTAIPINPVAINNIGQIVGTTNNNMYVMDPETGLTPVPGGLGYDPIGINAGTPSSQIISETSIWTENPTNSVWGFPIPLNSLLSTNSGWTLNGVISLNDAGAMLGNATYSGTNTAISAGPHPVMLLPLSFVRETTPGSGDFEPITDSGLDDNAQLPIFASETGQGMTESIRGGYTMTAILSADLSGTSTSSVNVTYTLPGAGSYTGTLTETAAGSGVFQDSGVTNILTLAPSTQTTSSMTSSTLSATITIPSLSISSQPVTLIGTAPLNFQATAVMMDVYLSGALSTTTPNTISASFENGDLQNDAVTLTETGTNTRIFKDSANSITLTMTGYTGGSSMTINVTSAALTPSSFGATLTETNGTSLQFSNYSMTYGTASNDTPSTDGQSVFYVQFPGSAATSITLVSGSNSVTTTASPVTGQPNLLRTGKLVLLEPGDTFGASGITTLTVALPTGGGTPTVQLQMYGQTIVDPGTLHDAYLGFGIAGIDGSVHLGQVQAILTQNLGWAVPTIHAVSVKSDVLNEIPKHSLWYMFTHGLTSVWDTAPLQGFRLYNSSNPNDHTQAELFPSDVSANIGANTYELVFFNACFSADQTAGSAAPTFAANFNAREYVGWAGDQREIVAYSAAKNFFTDLENHSKVKDAITAENKNLGWISRSNLQLLTDQGDSIDLSGAAPANH
jgi:hypothetical protein